MGSFLDLNNFSNTEIEFIDNRTFGVKLFPPTGRNLEFTEITQVFPAQTSTNIEAVIKPELALPVYEINISYVPGATVTWDIVPPGCTVSNSGNGVFQISGIKNREVWEQVKRPTITIPVDYFGNVFYESSVYWTSPVGPKRVTWDVGVYVPVVLMEMLSYFNVGGVSINYGEASLPAIFAQTSSSNAIRRTIKIFDSTFNLGPINFVKIFGLIETLQSAFDQNANPTAIRRADSILESTVNSTNSAIKTARLVSQNINAIMSMTSNGSGTFNGRLNASVVSSMTIENVRAQKMMRLIIDTPQFGYYAAPLTGTDVAVDWGDGTSTVLATAEPIGQNSVGLIHQYLDAGIYEVIISGQITKYGVDSNTSDFSQDRISRINDFGELGLQSLAYGLQNANSLSYIAPLPSTVTDLEGTFRGINVTSINGLESWNTSNITNMQSTFANATAFNQNISAWSTINVTDMSSMFANATAFNQNISAWNTSNVTDMSRMFNGATAFNQNISTWNTSNVTDMSYMFSNSDSFNQPIGTWNTANVVNMSYMFNGNNAFNQPIGTWNTSKVNKMDRMFFGATAFNQNISTWDVSNVYDMTEMFRVASSLVQNISNWPVVITTTPPNFDTGSSIIDPVWGIASPIIGNSTTYAGYADTATTISAATQGFVSNAYTFSCWVKPTINNYLNNEFILIDFKRSDNTSSFKISITNDRRVKLYRQQAIGGTVNELLTNQVIIQNNWNHILVTMNTVTGGARQIFVNGTQATIFGSLPNNIGWGFGDNPRIFVGYNGTGDSIQQLWFHNQTLSSITSQSFNAFYSSGWKNLGVNGTGDGSSTPLPQPLMYHVNPTSRFTTNRGTLTGYNLLDNDFGPIT